jgi:hypothetical protein
MPVIEQAKGADDQPMLRPGQILDLLCRASQRSNVLVRETWGTNVQNAQQRRAPGLNR